MAAASSSISTNDPNSDFGTGPGSPTGFFSFFPDGAAKPSESWVSPSTGQAFHPSSRSSAANSAANPCRVRISRGATFFTSSFSSAWSAWSESGNATSQPSR